MIHESAYVEDAEIGEGTNIWHFVHVRKDAKIGKKCNIGKGVYIDINVVIGDNCKIQNFATLYDGVTVGNNVFIVVDGHHFHVEAVQGGADNFIEQFPLDRFPQADFSKLDNDRKHESSNNLVIQVLHKEVGVFLTFFQQNVPHPVGVEGGNDDSCREHDDK